MNKTLLFLILATCTVIISVVVISIAPNVNDVHGQSIKWATQNCEIIADRIKLLKDDITTLKKMKNLCYREKAMHNMEYATFIINIILGFVCADLALIHYLGFGKDFEIKTGVIGFIAGVVGFILTLVYVCYSGYIFTNDVAFLDITISPTNIDYDDDDTVERLYSNGARYKWKSEENPTDPNDKDYGKYVTEYENDREDYSNKIRYKDLGKKQYNYNSKYYKKYKNYNDKEEDENKCPDPHNFVNDPTYYATLDPLDYDTKYKKNGDDFCEYIYAKPEEKIRNKKVFDKWLSSLILACVVLLTNLGVAVFGLLHCANFGVSSGI
jgi:hypothetical protein